MLDVVEYSSWISVHLLPGIMALFLAITHIFSGKLLFLKGIPRNEWLSVASGVSVAYVFVHILPELSEAQETVNQEIEVIMVFCNPIFT